MFYLGLKVKDFIFRFRSVKILGDDIVEVGFKGEF